MLLFPCCCCYSMVVAVMPILLFVVVIYFCCFAFFIKIKCWLLCSSRKAQAASNSKRSTDNNKRTKMARSNLWKVFFHSLSSSVVSGKTTHTHTQTKAKKYFPFPRLCVYFVVYECLLCLLVGSLCLNFSFTVVVCVRALYWCDNNSNLKTHTH